MAYLEVEENKEGYWLSTDGPFLITVTNGPNGHGDVREARLLHLRKNGDEMRRITVFAYDHEYKWESLKLDPAPDHTRLILHVRMAEAPWSLAQNILLVDPKRDRKTNDAFFRAGKFDITFTFSK